MTWETFPSEFTDAVQEVTGPVTRARSAPRRVAGAAVSIEASNGPFFLKTVETTDPAYSSLERERRITAAMPPGRLPAPALVAAVHSGGHAGLIFEHAPGRDADLSPGSADIPAVAAMLGTLSRTPAWPGLPPIADDLPALTATAKIAGSLPPPVDQHLLADALSRFSPGDLAGDRAVHGDLSPQNIRVDDGEATVVDWEHACAGPEWADPLMTLMLLVMDGHSPAEAENAVLSAALREAPGSAADGLLALLTLNCLHAARFGPLENTRVRVRAAEAGQALLAHRAANRAQYAGAR